MISTGAGCSSYADKLSAYVDSALPVAEQEEISTHVAQCPSCRDEVAALRGVRNLLRGQTGDCAAPTSLPHRLREIAGDAADKPLWSRPFGRCDATSRGFARLPSRRRAERTRGLIGVGSVVILVAGLAMIGWAAAPQSHEVVVEPTTRARAEFASALNGMPLSNAAVSAVAANPAAPQGNWAPAGSGPTTNVRGVAGGGADCLHLLQRAQRAATGVAVSGEQIVQHRAPGGWVANRVAVDNMPGFGTSLELLDSAGADGVAFVPRGQPTIVDLSSLQQFELTCNTLAGEVAGRLAAVVQAAETPAAGPRVRWWLDVQTGYPLWTERYAEGILVASSGFTALEVGPEMSGLSAPSGQDAAEPASVPQLAGLPLRSVQSDAPGGDGDCVRSVYGDGLTTLTVLRQPGTLVPGTELDWNAEAQAWQAADGAMTVVAWQSGTSVWTVVTDGTPEVVADAVRELPKEPPPAPNALDRVWCGLAWIADRIGLR